MTFPAAGSAAVRGNSSSTNGNGPAIYGDHINSTGAAPAVLGETNSTNGSATAVKGVVLPTSPGSSSVAVLGQNNGTGSNGIGIEGTQAGAGFGVAAFTGSGGIGVSASSGPGPATGFGVWAESNSTGANAAGVAGSINSNAANAAGVRGANFNASCCGMGVAGFHSGQGIGVYGEANNGFAVSGFSPNNWSGYFQGSVNVVGTLYKSSGAFRIDNPLEPAHSYLQHSFVESPDMKNVYDGVVTTNGSGFATVTLPKWFQALNRDFRYQLTIVGARGWRARVVKEISHNRFTIQSDEPRVKVSWQVTGIRHDAYANAHRIQTVVPKTGSADGKYVHPELYGKPTSKSVVVLPGMTRGTQPDFKTPTLARKR